ncbi:MAG: ParB/RepB/Spo0J family partition protein, partial [Proteobacteria bacterium]|nr:ParB/RepB/Spo0J family partition protein [Pseudomonadota bacterium]
MIRLDLIRENGHNVRRVAASAQADAALLDSIRAQGVLVPVLLRPEDDGGYTLIAGHRRVRAAREVGLEHIPALVLDGLVNGHATAAQAAENMVRAAMHPVDQWRAIVQLQDEGYALHQAAAALGMNERFARRLERLGRLHPDMLALIEEVGLPSDRELSDIALATPEAQQKALKTPGGIVREGGKVRQIAWWKIVHALDAPRFYGSDAIFDTNLMEWDEDLFAEPGSREQFTTTDAKTFLKLQAAALAEIVAERQAKKQRVQLGS